MQTASESAAEPQVVTGAERRLYRSSKERVVAGALDLHLPAFIDHGRGASFTDVDGNTFLDFAGGLTLSGSVVAFAKLQELMTTRPVIFGGMRWVMSAVVVVLIPGSALRE